MSLVKNFQIKQPSVERFKNVLKGLKPHILLMHEKINFINWQNKDQPEKNLNFLYFKTNETVLEK